MTQAIRSSGVSPLIRPEHMEAHYSVLEKLGVHLPTDIKKTITDQITGASTVIAPKMTAAMQTHTVLKVQRSLHHSLLQGKFLHDQELKRVAMGVIANGAPKLRFASYVPGSGRLVNAAFAYEIGDDGGDDGWSDGDDPELQVDSGDGDTGGGYTSGDGGEDDSSDSGDDFSESFSDGMFAP